METPGKPQDADVLQMQAPGSVGAGTEEDLRVPLLVQGPTTSVSSREPEERIPGARHSAPETPATTAPTYRPFTSEPVLQGPEVAAFSGGFHDVGRFWKQQQPFQIALLCASLFSLTTFMIMDMGTGVFLAAEFAGILSIISALCALMPRITGGLDLPSQIKIAYSLGVFSGSLDLLTLFTVDLVLLAVVGDCTNSAAPVPPEKPGPGDEDAPVPCSTAWFLLAYMTTLLGGHAWMCFRMSRQAKSAEHLLNPVSSGMVQV